MEPLHPQPGSPIDARNAVGRGAVITNARTLLDHGNDLVLTDPRRMGKTVLLDLLRMTWGDEVVKIDYEGTTTSREFLLRTVTALSAHQSVPRRAVKTLASWFDGIEASAMGVTLKKETAGRPVTVLLHDAIRAVDAHLDGRRLVVAMDEVPLAILNVAKHEDPHEAHAVLQVLRKLRREGRGIRWIVCGSVGFHHVLRRCGATEGAINDLVPLPLGPLDDPEAERLAHRLLLGVRREPEERDREGVLTAMVERSGGIPFLLHQLGHLLGGLGRGPATTADVAAAFDAFVDDRDSSRAITHLLTRLDDYYEERAPEAASILDHVARRGPTPARSILATPASDRATTMSILDDLVDDHYLRESADQLSWRYDVLRRIWIRKQRLP